VHTDVEYTRLLNYRALSKILKGEKSWPEVPLAKLQWSHLAQTIAELAVDILGPEKGFRVRGDDPVLIRAYLPSSELGAVLNDIKQ